VSIFEWRSDNSESYLDANEKAQHQLKTIRSQTESDYILSAALQNAELAIRRILTTLTSIEKLTS
jgi:predicted ATP-dependent endonuclease of OLD family